MVETGVIHGRFQVLHNDHLRYLLAGKDRCRHLVVGITNPDPGLTRDDDADPGRSRPENNPLTYFERLVLVREALLEAGVSAREFDIVPFPVSSPELYRYYVPLDAVFFLTIYDDWGRRKRSLFQSLGLRCDVMWERPLQDKGLSGREIRRAMARGDAWKDRVPPAVRRLLESWDIEARLRA
jgi:nicotinamide mononucleotide adenylyltransferase